MSFLAIDDANAIYTCSDSLNIRFHTVDDRDFRQLFRMITVLERSLGDAADDEYWSKFIRLMISISYDCCPFAFQLARFTIS
jgi:hypothetical protein